MAMRDTEGFSGTGRPASEYTEGERVMIWKYGCVYDATVVKVGKTRVTVNFTNKSGGNKDFTFDSYGVEHYVRKLGDYLHPRG